MFRGSLGAAFASFGLMLIRSQGRSPMYSMALVSIVMWRFGLAIAVSNSASWGLAIGSPPVITMWRVSLARIFCFRSSME